MFQVGDKVVHIAFPERLYNAEVIRIDSFSEAPVVVRWGSELRTSRYNQNGEQLSIDGKRKNLYIRHLTKLEKALK